MKKEMIVCLAAGLCMGFLWGIVFCTFKGPQQYDYTNLLNKIYNYGRQNGALVVINYDRKSDNLEPFGSWKEYDDYVKEENSVDIKKWYDEWQKKRDEAQKNYPPKPWAKK